MLDWRSLFRLLVCGRDKSSEDIYEQLASDAYLDYLELALLKAENLEFQQRIVNLQNELYELKIYIEQLKNYNQPRNKISEYT